MLQEFAGKVAPAIAAKADPKACRAQAAGDPAPAEAAGNQVGGERAAQARTFGKLPVAEERKPTHVG
jgi:hypothetical protein